MTLQDFITQNTGKGLNFDGAYGNQCMDLFEFYNRDVVGNSTPVAGNAIDVPNTYPKNFYTWIANTPTGVPTAGDVVIWGNSPGLTGQFGHIDVFISGDANNFTGFDQNWPTQEDANGNGTGVCHQQAHNYTGVLGWLHPVPQGSTVYKGIDYTNVASVKVCIDIFDAVINQHQYVPVADVNAIAADLGLPSGSNKDAIVSAINKIKADSATKDTTIANLNKQIPDLEAQVNTLANDKASLQQQLQTAQEAQNEPNSGLPYKDLYTQAESNLSSAKQALADLSAKTNQQIAQLKNTSATTMPLAALWKILLSRQFGLS